MVVQTSDETWQAYNTYGGNSLYTCTTVCPPGNPTAYKGALKVSYNRPFDDSWTTPAVVAVQWRRVQHDPLPRGERLRRQLHQRRRRRAARGSLLLNHKLFISSGHDEYWSGDQRANVRPRATRASTSRSSAATRCSGRRASSPASTARARRTGRWCPTRRRTSTPGRPAGPGHLDGHLARPALQPAGGRRPAAERPHRAARSSSTPARRHHGAVRRTPSCACGATPPSRR